MTTTGFQTEAVLQHDNKATISNQVVSLGYSLSYHAAVQSMLVSLYFRNWLSASETDLLKRVVPKPACLRLQLGEQVISEGEPDEFANASTDHPCADQSDAIFTQVWRPNPTDSTSAGLIHTASAGSINNQDLILSVFEPRFASSQSDLSDQIGAMVAQFRQDLARATMAWVTLKMKLPEEGAYLVINRASGRVIIASEAAGVALNSSVVLLVDREYSTLAESLSSLALKSGLHLENLTVGDMHLATVTFLSSQPKLSPPERDNFFDEFFVHTMRNKLGAITAASSHLETIALDEEALDARELTEIIQSQAMELDRQIERLMLWIEYDQLPAKVTCVDKEILTALDLIEGSLEINPVVNFEPTGSETELFLPVGALSTLIEAVLCAHLANRDRPGTTDLMTSENPNTIDICLTTNFDLVDQPAAFSARWQKFASRLSARMGCSCEHTVSDKQCLTTTIAICKERK